MAALPDLAHVEREHILETLKRVAGNRSRAARLLGIDRGTLARKLRALVLPSDGGNGK
jgi:DNA-binding NtrC family response regulator